MLLGLLRAAARNFVGFQLVALAERAKRAGQAMIDPEPAERSADNPYPYGVWANSIYPPVVGSDAHAVLDELAPRARSYHPPGAPRARAGSIAARMGR